MPVILRPTAAERRAEPNRLDPAPESLRQIRVRRRRKIGDFRRVFRRSRVDHRREADDLERRSEDFLEDGDGERGVHEEESED